MVTPHESYPDLAQALAIPNQIYFKREDLHPYGSHKGRSIPVMIDEAMEKGCKHFAISSSGNAALAAGIYINKLNKDVRLEILVGRNISPNKLAKLETIKNEKITISSQADPLKTLSMKTEDPSIQSLRQSTNDTSLKGYSALAEELLEIKSLKAVFIGTSSGTTAQALAEYFMKNKKDIEVHIVQTTSCHPIAEGFVENASENNEKSLADAIVDKTALRKTRLIELLKETGGSGWIAKNEDIRMAQEMSEKHAIPISPNSALAVAGLMQAVYTGKSWDGAVSCMICGD